MDSRTQKASVFAPIPPEVERVGKIVLDAAFKVHTALGPGLLESVYETCHAYEIRESGLLVETQVAIPVTYRNIRLEGGLRLDLLVEKCVIVEIKAVETMNSVYEAQLLTYLRLTSIRLGYLIKSPCRISKTASSGWWFKNPFVNLCRLAPACRRCSRHERCALCV